MLWLHTIIMLMSGFVVHLNANGLNTTKLKEEDIAAKLVEGYVLAADFDHNPVPQVQNTAVSAINATVNGTAAEVGAASRIVREPDTRLEVPEIPDDHGVVLYPPRPSDRDNYLDHGGGYSPSPLSQRSIFAVGFITFLILLTTLQGNTQNLLAASGVTQPAYTRPSTTLLGGVTQALGRRKR